MRGRSTIRAMGVLVAVGGLVVLGTVGHASDGYEGVENPHGKEDQCSACHTPSGGLLPVVPTCRSCHPTADMHPVDLRPDKVAVPDQFPLVDGRMVCSTCHQEPAHRHVAEMVEKTPELPSPWHRGGPYTDTLEFCNTCHETQALARVNPHHGPNPPDPTADGCTTCHVAAPEPGASVAEAKLRLAPPAVCSTCHVAPHAGVTEHFLQELPEGVDLPSDNGRIVCFTCHDVHGGGPAGDVHSKLANELAKVALSTEWSPVAEGLTLPGAARPNPPMLAAPLEDGKLCRLCHGEGP